MIKSLILKDIDQIEQFKSKWEFLHKQSDNCSIYNSFDFIFHSICNFKDATLKNHIIVFFEDDQAIAIFPFQIYLERRYLFKFRTLEYIAQDEIDKPAPIVLKGYEAKAWSSLYQYLELATNEWDILSLMEVRSSSNHKKLNDKLCQQANYLMETKLDKSGPEIYLNKPWQEFWDNHKKMRKKVNKLQSDFKDKVSFEINPFSWQENLKQYINLEGKSWKKGKVGISKDEETLKFYFNFFESLSNKRKLVFGFLYVNEEIVSAEIAYLNNEKVYFSHGCYDNNFQKYSPGMISTSFFIKHFMGKHYSRGDFLCGYSGYLNAWSEDIIETLQINIYNRNFNNRILFSYRTIKNAFRTYTRPIVKLYYAINYSAR